MLWYKVLFSFKGRLNRQGFWSGVGINILLLALSAHLLPDATSQPLSLLPLLFIGYSLIAVIVKRLHDRNRSAWAVLILFVPLICYMTSLMSQGIMAWLLGSAMPIFIGTMLLIEWGVFKGNPEPNQYGEIGLTIKFK